MLLAGRENPKLVRLFRDEPDRITPRQRRLAGLAPQQENALLPVHFLSIVEGLRARAV